MKNYAKAFTLIELLVAMVVSSAVIASSYFIYNTFSKNLVDYRKHISKLSDGIVLNGVLSHDMNYAKAIRKNLSNGIILDHGERNIEYEWQEHIVVRISTFSSDTFRLAVNNPEVNFMGKEQTLIGGLVDQLKLTSLLEEQELVFYFEKKYGSDILVESEKISDGGN